MNLLKLMRVVPTSLLTHFYSLSIQSLIPLFQVDMLLSYGLTENALSISKMASLQHPSSPTVWITRIQCETAFGEDKEQDRVTSLFREAIDQVPSKVTSIFDFGPNFITACVCRYRCHCGSTGLLT